MVSDDSPCESVATCTSTNHWFHHGPGNPLGTINHPGRNSGAENMSSAPDGDTERERPRMVINL